MEIKDSEGQTCGFVEQRWAICKPKYAVTDANGETVLHIEGPCLTCGCWEIKFQVSSRIYTDNKNNNNIIDIDSTWIVWSVSTNIFFEKH